MFVLVVTSQHYNIHQRTSLFWCIEGGDTAEHSHCTKYA